MHLAEPIDHLRLFVHLQRRLWRALRVDYPAPLSPGLTVIPGQGQVTVDGETWEFRRHGSGVLFSEADGKRKIDLHDAFVGPDQLDTWRLATYFGALGRAGEKLVGQVVARQGPMEERLRLWLDGLVNQGVLIARGGGYCFSADC